jgi:hypothetical protein
MKRTQLIFLLLVFSGFAFSQDYKDTNQIEHQQMIDDLGSAKREALKRKAERLKSLNERDSILKKEQINYKVFVAGKYKGLVKEGLSVDTLLMNIYSDIELVNNAPKLFRVVDNQKRISIYNAESKSFVFRFSEFEIECIASDKYNSAVFIVKNPYDKYQTLHDVNGKILCPYKLKGLYRSHDFLICKTGSFDMLYDREGNKMNETKFLSLDHSYRFKFLIARTDSTYGIVDRTGTFFYESRDSLYPLIKTKGISVLTTNRKDSLVIISIAGNFAKIAISNGAYYDYRNWNYIVSVNGKFGLLDMSLQWKINPIYKSMNFFTDPNQRSKILLSVNDGKGTSIIDLSGTVVKNFSDVSQIIEISQSPYTYSKLKKGKKYLLYNNDIDSISSPVLFNDIHDSDSILILRKGNTVLTYNKSTKAFLNERQFKIDGFQSMEECAKELLICLKSNDENALKNFAKKIAPDSLFASKIASLGVTNKRFFIEYLNILDLQDLYYKELLICKKYIESFCSIEDLQLGGFISCPITTPANYNYEVNQLEPPVRIKLYSKDFKFNFCFGNICIVEKKVKALYPCSIYNY